MTFSVTPAEFNALKASLKASGKASVTESTPTSGQLNASGVTIAYEYDGQDTLTANVTARHGLAALDSEADVEKRVTQMLNQFISGESQ